MTANCQQSLLFFLNHRSICAGIPMAGKPLSSSTSHILVSALNQEIGRSSGSTTRLVLISCALSLPTHDSLHFVARLPDVAVLPRILRWTHVGRPHGALPPHAGLSSGARSQVLMGSFETVHRARLSTQLSSRACISWLAECQRCQAAST